jgi:hypothetical protein
MARNLCVQPAGSKHNFLSCVAFLLFSVVHIHYLLFAAFFQVQPIERGEEENKYYTYYISIHS